MKRLGLVAVLVAIFLPASCIFDTRDPQPPSGGTSGGCVLSSPQSPFGCMADALAALVDGDYDRSISDRFIFSPTTADSLDQFFAGTCVFDNWNKQEERDHIGFLVSDSAKLTWDYGTLVPKINKNTFVRFETDYSLLVINKAVPPDTTAYRGVAEIDVRNEGGNWRVTYWKETQTVQGSLTWGYLRGTTRKQSGDTCP